MKNTKDVLYPIFFLKMLMYEKGELLTTRRAAKSLNTSRTQVSAYV
jgi:hypothetical protein